MKKRFGTKHITSQIAPVPLLTVEAAQIHPCFSAHWISPIIRNKKNVYFLVRKKFHIKKRPSQAILWVTADSYYALYLNGRYIGNGPARGSHHRYFVDGYDITRFLKSGDNWLAAEVHCPGKATFKTAPHGPGFWAQSEGILATDSSWQVMVDPSHDSKSLPFTDQIGFSEWKDLSAESAGWKVGKDKSPRWQQAREVGTAEDYGRRTLSPRPIAPLTQDLLRPVKVVDIGYVPDAGKAIRSPHYAKLMSRETLYPQAKALANPSGLMGRSGRPAVLSSYDGKGIYLIIDFGRKVLGNLVLDICGSAGTVVDIAYDEVAGNTCPVVREGEYYFADRFVLRSGRQTIEQNLHTRGFQYLKIVFRNVLRPVEIFLLGLVNRIYSQNPRATFECNDPFWNSLWQSCVNTIRMCAGDTFLDCPWREQAFWINDHSVVNLFYLQITGDKRFAGHNLRLAADGALPNGLIPAVYPSDRNPNLCFPMIPGSWTISLHDYLLYTGDLSLVRELAPVMEKGLALYETWRNSDGLVPDQPGMWNFIDWGYKKAGAELGGTTAALNMYVAAGLDRAARIEEALGRHEKANLYYTKRCQTIQSLNRTLWDRRKGCYRDCTKPKNRKFTFSQHPHALGLYFDLLPNPQARRSVANLLSPDLIQAELFHQHYVLDALAAREKIKRAMAVIKSLWSPMIRAGSDTIWETTQGRATFGGVGSLCHAFSCTPIHFIQTSILGVRPLQPGFCEFSFNPYLSGFNHVQGEIPTPYGNIRVTLNRDENKKPFARLLLPKGTSAVIPQGITLKYGIYQFHNCLIECQIKK